MPLDPSIALQVQTPNPTAMISSFLDLGQKKLQLDKSRQTFDADVARSQADSSTAQSNATVNAANVPSLIAEQTARTSSAQTAASGSQFQLTAQQAGLSRQIAGGLAADPDIVAGKDPDAIIGKIADARQQMIDSGVPRGIAEAQASGLIDIAHKNPGAVGQQLKNWMVAGQSAAQQGAAITPNGPIINNGQQFKGVNTNPLAAGGVGSTIPGTSGQAQLPPTTQTMVNGQPQFLGPQAAAGPGAGPVASGASIGQAEGITGPIATNNAHYAQVQQDAAGASDRIASLENIKQEIPKAVMGGNLPGNAIRSMLSGLSGVFGFANDATTANDLMAKNLAQIAAKSGNTDAARTFGEMGSPNAHVTPEAGTEAVAQIVGVERKKQAASDFFGGTPTNSPDYTNKLQVWNRYADPRAFQYASLPADEQAKMKATMKQAGTWSSLNNNMSHLAAMGVNP